jgi:hypothetical protein
MELEELQQHAWEKLSMLVGPAAGASLVMMLIIRLAGGQRVGSLATLLAVAAGVYVGAALVSNSVSDEYPWQLESDPKMTLKTKDLLQVFVWSLEEKPALPEDGAAQDGTKAAEDPPSLRRMPLYWLAYLAGLAMLVEMLLPMLVVPAEALWVVRTVIALLAGRLLTPGFQRMEHAWIPWALGLAILLEWGILATLARRWRDGVVPTALGFCCVAASMVLIAAAYATACDYALLAGAALAGPALVSWNCPSDTAPAGAACAVILPGLVLAGYNGSTDEAIPIWSFMLAGLAPLALLPLCLPALARQEGLARWLPGLVLPLIPAVLAVVWAMQTAPIAPP